jgi:hypothetical protein
MIKWMIKAHPTENRMARQAMSLLSPSPGRGLGPVYEQVGTDRSVE